MMVTATDKPRVYRGRRGGYGKNAPLIRAANHSAGPKPLLALTVVATAQAL